jgi:hypothetical protein
VILKGDTALIKLGARFRGAQSYLELAPALGCRSEIDYVDLRFDRRVYVRAVDARGSER